MLRFKLTRGCFVVLIFGIQIGATHCKHLKDFHLISQIIKQNVLVEYSISDQRLQIIYMSPAGSRVHRRPQVFVHRINARLMLEQKLHHFRVTI